jgi:hypothetical protein
MKTFREIAEMHYTQETTTVFDEQYKQTRINALEKLLIEQLTISERLFLCSRCKTEYRTESQETYIGCCIMPVNYRTSGICGGELIEINENLNNMEEEMNIYAPEGTKVKYTGQNGSNNDQEYANKHLKIGNTYTIAFTDVDDYHTDVCLKEVPNQVFNSVHFTSFVKHEMTKEEFITERTRIISEMLDNPGECGIYPTGKCFEQLDELFDKITAN